MVIILIAGAIAAYGWWRALKRRDEIIPGWMRAAVLIGALGGFGSVAYAAYLGGKIIHDAPVLQLPDGLRAFRRVSRLRRVPQASTLRADASRLMPRG